MEKEIISSIDRALEILMLLYQEEKELGVTEIAKGLKLHKSTVHRTLITLENRGFVQKNEHNEKYWLGVKLYALGMMVGDKLPLTQIIKPFAEKLSDKFGQTVNVSVLDYKNSDYPKTILVLKEEPEGEMKVNPKLGSSSESHYSAVGKCLLAYVDKEVLDRFKGKDLPVYTSNTISSWEELQTALSMVRMNGYAIDDEEVEVGFTCVASPIIDSNGEAIAAISISGKTELIKSNFELIVREVKSTASQISSLLK